MTTVAWRFSPVIHRIFNPDHFKTETVQVSGELNEEVQPLGFPSCSSLPENGGPSSSGNIVTLSLFVILTMDEVQKKTYL
jgi:hypothetical protein